MNRIRFLLGVLATSIVRDIQEQRSIASGVMTEALLLRLPPDLPVDALVLEYVGYQYGDLGENAPAWITR